MCDKRKDCQDGSDESAATCGPPPCPDHTFQCGDRTCIEVERVCDGVLDCRDQSDEKQPSCCTYHFPVFRYALPKILHIAGSFLLIEMHDLFDVNKKQPCFRSDVDTEEKNEGSVQRVRQLCEQSLDSSKLHPCNAKSD